MQDSSCYSLSQPERDHILDRYPVNDEELNRILCILRSEPCVRSSSTKTFGLSRSFLGRPFDGGKDKDGVVIQDDDEGKEEKVSDGVSIKHGTPDRNGSLMVTLEERLLPELASVVMNTVGTIESDNDNVFNHVIDRSDELQHIIQWVEACVSLLGRRTETQTTAPLRALFLACVPPETENHQESNDVSADPVKLASLIQRLYRAYLWLTSDYCLKDQEDDDVLFERLQSQVPQHPSTPKPWISSLQSAARLSDKQLNWTAWCDWVLNHTPTLPLLWVAVLDAFLFGPTLRPQHDDSNESDTLLRHMRGRQHLFQPVRARLSDKDAALEAPILAPPSSNGTGTDNSNLNKEAVFVSLQAQLSLMGLGMAGTWRRQYCSDEDGLSFPALVKALTGFAGPTVLLVQTTGDNQVLGYYTRKPWMRTAIPKWQVRRRRRTQQMDSNSGEVSSQFEQQNSRTANDDEDEAFLFRLRPDWAVFRLQEPNEALPIPASFASQNGVTKGSPACDRYFQMLYMPAAASTPRHRQQQQQQKKVLSGLAVGGIAADTPRFHLTPTLEGCRAYELDYVFAPGPLLATAAPGDDELAMCVPTSTFDVDWLQVWAVESQERAYEQGLRVGRLQQDLQETTRQRVAQVDKKQFVDDFAKGAFMNRLYSHREQTRGRASFIADNREGGRYYVEGKPPPSSSSSSSSPPNQANED